MAAIPSENQEKVFPKDESETSGRKPYLDDQNTMTSSASQKTLPLEDRNATTSSDPEKISASAEAMDNMKDFWDKEQDNLIATWKKYGYISPEQYEHPKEEPPHIAKSLKYRSVVILTASPLENRYISKRLAEECGHIETYVTKDNSMYHVAILDGIAVVHFMQQDTSSFTEKGSNGTAKAALKRFRPKFAVSLGVAFGVNPANQKLGDVVVSTSILAYDEKKKVSEGDVAFTEDSEHPWNGYLKNLWNSFKEIEKFPGKGADFSWCFAPILSGSDVISDIKWRSKLVEAAEERGCKVCAGEMEGWGLQNECDSEEIPWAVIKGICDWAVFKNSWGIVVGKNPEKLAALLKEEQKNKGQVINGIVKDSVQILAAENAFQVFRYLLRYSKELILAESNIPRKEFLAGKFHEKVDSIKTYLKESAEFHGVVVRLSLILAIAIFWGKSLISLYRRPTAGLLFLTVLIAAALVIYVRYRIFRRKEKRSVPRFMEICSANLEITALDFARGVCKIRNLSKETLEQFSVTWQNRRKNVQIEGGYLEKLEPEMKLEESIYGNPGSQKPEREYIRPDLLRIEYRMAGTKFCHVVGKLAGRRFYVETVYRWSGSSYVRLYRSMFRENDVL